MTTWLEEEPIEYALWYLLSIAWPSEEHRDGTKASLVILVGEDSDRRDTIVRALTDPATFLAEQADVE